MLSMKQKEKTDRSFDGSTRLVDQRARELWRAMTESRERTAQGGRGSSAALEF